MKGLEIDLETRATVSVVDVGVYRYVEDPHCDVLMASYRIDGGPWRRWRRGEPCPADIRAHVEAGGIISAHNAAFERMLWWHVLTPKHGWPRPALEQFRCVAVTAAAMALPRSLDRLGAALDLPVQKDKNGKAFIKRHSMPTGFGHNGGPLWDEDPESLEGFHQYCDIDVQTEAAADARLVELSDDEQAVYVLNERINDRGVRIDVGAARAALRIAEAAKERLNAEMHEITGGAVEKVTQVARLLAWLKTQGVELPALDKDEIDETLAECDDLPEIVHRALELRQEGAKPSVDKIAAMLQRVCADGRVRGVYLHHGAGQTGRFSSRGVQAHNMPKYRKVFEDAFEKGKLGLDVLFDTIRTGEPDALQLAYGPVLGRPLHLLSDAVRSFIWAAPGHRFINADYTSIEGVMAAWFANEEWKLEAYRALNRGEGHGIYELAAAGIYGIPVESVTKAHRPTGKVAELSCQYQTGVGGIRKFARTSKIKLGGLYGALWEAAEPGDKEKAEERFEDRLKHHDAHAAALGREGWLAAELIKVGWRNRHPNIVDAWKDLDDAVKAAVTTPGTVFKALSGRVAYVVRHGFLWCRLPSGRCLAYGRPRFADVDAPWADPTVEPAKREKVRSVVVLGVDAQSEKWVRHALYGGKLFNNCLAGDAEVLTATGWKALRAVTRDDLVWDGVEWVEHDGLVDQGEAETMIFNGVEMTPDHEVLTDEGWKKAEHARVHSLVPAPPDTGSSRPSLRAADGPVVRGWRWAKGLVERALRLRHGEDAGRRRDAEGLSHELRLRHGGVDCGAQSNARDERAPGLPGVQEHVGSLHQSEGPGVSELRRAGYLGRSALVDFRGLLGRHGADVGLGADARPAGQRQRLLAGELRLAHAEGARAQQANQPDDRHPARADAAVRGFGCERDRRDDAGVPACAGLADAPPVSSAGRVEPRRLTRVYDLLNCGPRHRFTVRGAAGPFIVHNCVQGSARDILVNGMRNAEAAGYPIVLHTHDECMAEVPNEWGSVEDFEKLICQLPDWARDIPLKSSGWAGKRYHK
jgi:DNA polymerase